MKLNPGATSEKPPDIPQVPYLSICSNTIALTPVPPQSKMWIMALARHAILMSRFIPCLIVFTLFSAFHAPAKTWNTQAAAQALQEAQQKRIEIAQNVASTLSQYRQCANTYRKVYLHDPHYSRAGDAIYEEALLYQEMGEKFSDLKSYATAVKRFEFLVKDYGSNQNRADALLRAGNIYQKAWTPIIYPSFRISRSFSFLILDHFH
jgi:hypothetical protein